MCTFKLTECPVCVSGFMHNPAANEKSGKHSTANENARN